MKTKYRIVNNGYWDFIQYEIEHKFLWFKWSEWSYVWRPYYCEFMGRFDSTGADTYICSINTNIENFVNKYPDISVYFELASKEQEEIESKVRQKINERNERQQVIKYL
jgi:hypothetical protein